MATLQVLLLQKQHFLVLSVFVLIFTEIKDWCEMIIFLVWLCLNILSVKSIFIYYNLLFSLFLLL